MSNSSSPHIQPTTVPPSRRQSEAPQAASANPLPPAQLFDLLPHLHQLLARLLPPQPSDPLNPLAQPPPATTQPLLEIQNLAREASSLRVRIQKARQAIRELPDMDRTCEEQGEEIQELEETVRGLKGVLAGLGEANRAS